MSGEPSRAIPGMVQISSFTVHVSLSFRMNSDCRAHLSRSQKQAFLIQTPMLWRTNYRSL